MDRRRVLTDEEIRNLPRPDDRPEPESRQVPSVTPTKTIECADTWRKLLRPGNADRLRLVAAFYVDDLEYLAVAARCFGEQSRPIDRFITHWKAGRLSDGPDSRRLADDALDVVTATLRAAQAAVARGDRAGGDGTGAGEDPRGPSAKPVPTEGAAAKGAQQPWSDSAAGYVSATDALKELDNASITLRALSKLIRRNVGIRYMTKGHRCKVHYNDLLKYLNKNSDMD